MKTKNFSDLHLISRHRKYPIKLEQHIHKIARQLSYSDDKPYNDGDLWQSEKIGEGWFYSISYDRTWRIINPRNGAEVEVGTKVFSLAVFVIALSEFHMYLYKKWTIGALSDELAELYINVLLNGSKFLTEDEYRTFCEIVGGEFEDLYRLGA